MNTLVAVVGTYLLHSTVLLGVAALADRLGAGVAWTETLWKTALVGALLTTALQLSIGLAPAGGSIALELPTPTPAIETGPAVPALPLDAPEAAADGAALVPTPGPHTSWWDRLPLVLLGVWAAVSLALIVRFLLPFAVVHRCLLTASSPLPDLQARWDALARDAGAPARARLVVSDVLPTPAATVGGTVVVPTRFARDLSPDEQRAALAHELAHVVRRDPEWRLVVGLVARILLVQPLNAVASGRLRAVAETLSDEWAVRRASSSEVLAQCLVHVAAWGRPARLGAVGIVERPSALHARVRHLLDTPVMPRSVPLVARLALGAVLLVAVTAAAPRADLGTGKVVLTPLVRGDGHGPVVVAPDSIATLDGRWAWAEEQLRRDDLDGAYVGYAIARTRLQPGEVFIADSRGLEPGDLDRLSPLALQLLGPLADRAADLVGLFVVPGQGSPREVAVRTLSALGDLGGRPVIWLGVVPAGESLDRWARPASWPTPLAARRVTALAVHPLPDRVLPLLDAVALGDGPAEVRVQAVEGYGYHADAAHRAAVLARIDRVLVGAPPEPVLGEAVRALARLGGDDATRRLRTLLRSGPAERRRQSVHALEDIPAPLARELLADLLREPLPEETRRETENVLDDLGPVEADPSSETGAARPPARPTLQTDRGVESAASVSVGYDHVVTLDGEPEAVVWTTGTAAPHVERRPGGFAFTTGTER